MVEMETKTEWKVVNCVACGKICMHLQADEIEDIPMSVFCNVECEQEYEEYEKSL